LLSVFARSDFVLEYIQILEFRVCQPSQIKLVKVVQLLGLTPQLPRAPCLVHILQKL
jgi:hypothetical protein